MELNSNQDSTKLKMNNQRSIKKKTKFNFMLFNRRRRLINGQKSY